NDEMSLVGHIVLPLMNFLACGMRRNLYRSSQPRKIVRNALGQSGGQDVFGTNSCLSGSAETRRTGFLSAYQASGTPVLVTVSIFDDLQTAAQNKGISFGNQHIPNPKPLPIIRKCHPARHEQWETDT